MSSLLYADHALLPTGWAQHVTIEIEADGRLGAIRPDSPAPQGADRRALLLPALANLHSHAFQRAMAGRSHAPSQGREDFWSWREAMYALVERMTPEALQAIAAQLQVELLEAGWGSIAEFHYLHHAPDGGPYADRAEMAGRIALAARQTGIGLTMLPVLYVHGGFNRAAPSTAQSRFLNSPAALLNLREAATAHLTRADDTLGLAFHSLRAVALDELNETLDGSAPCPVHIHIAEQTREVAECEAAHGRPPVRLLLDEAPVNQDWCLVHATHMKPEEVTALARRGAIAGLCPTTEAELGDGLFPACAYLGAGGAYGFGTDSHIRRDPAGEIRLFEYGQRLSLRRRSVLADATRPVGRRLYEEALKGGAQALGRACGAIETGAWADLLALDADHALLAEASPEQALESWLFAGGADCVSDVWSAGRHVVRNGRHVRREAIEAGFRTAMKTLRR